MCEDRETAKRRICGLPLDECFDYEDVREVYDHLYDLDIGIWSDGH